MPFSTTSLYYDIAGTGAPVCLVNGYRLSSAAWPPLFIARLAARCTARQAWPVTYSPEYLATNAEAAELQMRRELEFPTPNHVARRQMEALRQFDSYRDLPRIRAATLVATGTHDLLVKPRNSAILADLIGDFLTRPSGGDVAAYRLAEAVR
jgi:pimeloyl-ACP methyl ester carboxylesterase